MMKKLLIAGLTTAALAMGIGASTAPASAQIYFGVGPGWGYHHYYHPGWGYGYHPGWGYYRPGPRCGWVVRWRHGHKIKRWRCW
jgi:hypothetical protein